MSYVVVVTWDPQTFIPGIERKNTEEEAQAHLEKVLAYRDTPNGPLAYPNAFYIIDPDPTVSSQWFIVDPVAKTISINWDGLAASKRVIYISQVKQEAYARITNRFNSVEMLANVIETLDLIESRFVNTALTETERSLSEELKTPRKWISDVQKVSKDIIENPSDPALGLKINNDPRWPAFPII